MTRPAGLWLLATLLAAAAGAVCAGEPSRIVELELQGCRPAMLAVEEQIAGSRVWWLRQYVSAIAEQAPGVVVRGGVRRWRRYEPPQTLGPWQEGGGDEVWFYPSLDREPCANFEPLESVVLVSHQPCCDVIPPADLACLLELAQARAPTPLERQMAGLAAVAD